MKIHEFEAKKLLAGFRVPVQVHAGGRGKGGGVMDVFLERLGVGET